MDLHEQDRIILERHQPTDAVRRLLESVVEDLVVAWHHIDQLNLGLAKDWIDTAMKKLPVQTDVMRLPWPQKEHVVRDDKFGFTPEYEDIYELELPRERNF